MDRLANKVAIVFGAGPNIGGTIAHFLAREGASVVVSDISLAAAQETVDRVRQALGQSSAPLVRPAASATSGRKDFDFSTLPEYEILKIWKALIPIHYAIMVRIPGLSGTMVPTITCIPWSTASCCGRRRM